MRANILKDEKVNWRILAIDGCNNTANLGSLIRSSTALGIDAIILSHDCCDPWYRQSIRVSMGHIFKMPIIRVSSLSETLLRLQRECHVQTFGAVIDEDVGRLDQVNTTTARWCGIVGNEDKGISKEVRDICLRENQKHGNLLRIDMKKNVDSMSITVAGGIFLHDLRRLEDRR